MNANSEMESARKTSGTPRRPAGPAAMGSPDRRALRQRLLGPWRQPWPWISLLLLLLASRSEPPRLWFWVALLLISLLVGLLQGLARRP